MKALIALTSIIGFLMVVLPGPLYQYAGVDLGTAFTSLRYGVYAVSYTHLTLPTSDLV